MVQQSISEPETALLTESERWYAHLRRPYNGAWVGDIRCFVTLSIATRWSSSISRRSFL
jgi:hypothetical protein